MGVGVVELVTRRIFHPNIQATRVRLPPVVTNKKK